MTEQRTKILIAMGMACVDWCNDTGECHFCMLEKGGRPHGQDCPVAEYQALPDADDVGGTP